MRERAAGEDEVAADAFTHAYHARNGQLAPPDLAAFAAALVAIGAFTRCEEVVARLQMSAGGDALLVSAAAHALARARLGQGRAAEALPLLQEAVAKCPIPEVRKEYNDTLALAQRGQAPPVKPVRAMQVKERAFAAIAAGDFATARQIAQGEQSWGAARAQLVVYSFRDGADLMQPVPGAARQYAEQLLAFTCGQTDADAVETRVHALEIRELASFAADTQPPLGPRLSDERLAALYAERGR
jgi:hypothetical protein